MPPNIYVPTHVNSEGLLRSPELCAGAPSLRIVRGHMPLISKVVKFISYPLRKGLAAGAKP